MRGTGGTTREGLARALPFVTTFGFAEASGLGPSPRCAGRWGREGPGAVGGTCAPLMLWESERVRGGFIGGNRVVGAMNWAFGGTGEGNMGPGLAGIGEVASAIGSRDTENGPEVPTTGVGRGEEGTGGKDGDASGS